MKTARAIIDSAGIIVAAENMTVCYDTRGTQLGGVGDASSCTQKTGVKYELPLYVLSAPTNLVKSDAAKGASASSQAVSLTAGA